MATRASRTDVTRLRLQGQLLAGDSPARALDVAERMLAVQAQDVRAGMWALGVRSPGLTAVDVETAIGAAEIVRSWPMRGTLHFVPARDLNWMLQLTAPRVLAGMRTRRDQLELDEQTVEHARTVALDSLSGGRELTRSGFLAALETNGIAIGGQRGYHLIANLALTGTLCWGPLNGSQQSLVLLDDWVRMPRRLEREEALGEFVLRYLAGHGPATVKDFVWWSQLTVADARVGFSVVRDRLTELDVDGVLHYLPGARLAGATDPGTPGLKPVQRSPVLALPGFDEYLLGYQERSFAVSDALFPRVVPGRNGIFLPLILAAGRIIGTWRTQRTARAVSVEAMPFATLTLRQRAGFERAIGDFARFTGLAATVLPVDGHPAGNRSDNLSK
jgi:hypothetical protein